MTTVEQVVEIDHRPTARLGLRFKGCAPWWRIEPVRRAGRLILGLVDNVVIETEDSLIPSKLCRSSTPADSIFSRS